MYCFTIYLSVFNKKMVPLYRAFCQASGQAGGGGARPEAETKPPPRPAGWPVQPPLPVRSAIVGTTVGLATPLFPVVGFVRAVRYFVPDATLRIMMYGGTGVLLSFAVRDLLPFMYQHAPLLAPSRAPSSLRS